MKPEKFLSLSALARRLDIPDTRASALVKSGILTPDATAGRVLLFNPSRLPELSRLAAKRPTVS